MAKKKGLTFYKKKKKVSASVLREIWSWLFCIGVAFLLAFAVVYSVGMRTSMIGVSMEPNLHNGQTVFANRLIYMISSPKRGDVIVFLPNGNSNSHYYIKRVVALPGETVQIIDGKLYVNGVLQEEEYDKIAEPGIAQNEIKLGANEYFVLGDNRNNSEDSRSGNIGNVKEDMIAGKAWFHWSWEDGSMGIIR